MSIGNQAIGRGSLRKRHISLYKFILDHVIENLNSRLRFVTFSEAFNIFLSRWSYLVEHELIPTSLSKSGVADESAGSKLTMS